MKKTFLMIMALLMSVGAYSQRNAPTRSALGNGQNENREVRSAQVNFSAKKTAFYLGLKAGVDFTTMTQPEESKLYNGMGTGFNAGLMVKTRFNQASPSAAAGTGLVGLGLELKYKLNSVKTIGTDGDGKTDCNMNLGYFEIPLYLQLFPFYKSDAMNTFYIEVGPDFAFLTSKSPKTLTVSNPSDYASSVTYHIGDLKGGDVRILAGLGYDLPLRNKNNEIKNLIGINARYYIGTSKLASNFNSKMNTFELSLSWMFNVGNL